MFNLDIEPISPRLKNNRDTYEVYIEKTIEYTDTLRDVQELLVYASQTCPNSPEPSEELIVVTPIKKDKIVRFAKPVRNAKFESIQDLGKLNAKADIGIFVGYTPAKKAFRIYNRRTWKYKETIHVTFDELTAMAHEQFVAAALRAVEIADSPVSTFIDQDAPSSSILSTQDQEHSLIISQRVEELLKTPLFHYDPLHERLHEDSTSQGSSSNMRPSYTPFELIGRWTKDHPIANMIGAVDLTPFTWKEGNDLLLVPSAERVKISSTNIRSETTVPPKEEIFQAIIDVIRNFTCFKAFTISEDVSEIFMQQIWYTIKKVPDTNSYEFLLANKNCTVNAEVFRIILDICPRVEGVDFTNVPNDDTAVTFFIDLAYKEYRLLIPDVMLTDAIKHSESYQMFIKYSTNQIPPKKSRGKAKKKTSCKRRIKKKVTLLADDNIFSDDPDTPLELAKSISQTEVEEAEAARKVHATHARIVTESVLESAKKKSGGRSSKSVVIQDTQSTPQSKLATSKSKLKGAPSLNSTEQEATNIMQALKESKKISRRQPGDEQDSEYSNDDVKKDDKDGDADADDEGDDHVSDIQDADDEDVKTESNKDDIYKYKIRVRKDNDVEMKDAKVKGFDKGDEEITNAVTKEAKKTSEAKTQMLVLCWIFPSNAKLPNPHLPELTKKSTPTAEQESKKSPLEILKINKEQAEPVEEPIAELIMDDVGDDVARDDNPPQDTSESKTRKNLNTDWFKQPIRPPTPDLEWNKHQLYLINPHSLGHQTVAADYFFNNDMEYLKTSDPEAILGVKSVSVKKLHGYGHLEEIMVKISDQQLYTFKEDDFVDLHLNNIEDMLLLVVQHKIFHLDGNVIVDFILALLMFTRSVILERRVKV
nr:integrase, catalytic region, zinc finger, CCHC-type, peptidase aspartic, catalytic [Tanacetum cinerariifolium]